LSYRFGLPIAADEWGVRARLTFSGVPFDCELPWPSIYMIVSHVTGQPFLFPEHVPQELMQLATQMRSDGQIPEQPKKPKLTVVGGDDGPAEEAPVVAAAEVAETAEETPTDAIESPSDEVESEVDGEPTPPRTPPRRGHLRVVK
jgi:hypothetical protein